MMRRNAFGRAKALAYVMVVPLLITGGSVVSQTAVVQPFRAAWPRAEALGYGLPALAAQDVEYIRAVERVQKERPAALSATARIAPAGEPGTPLVLHGRVVTASGSPAAGAIVFAYHTDRTGIYDRREAGPHSWRLKGWTKAGPDGRFTFETIRPGSYPNSNNPAHVHFTVFLPSGERYHAGEVQFANDPLIPQHLRDAGARDEFAAVRPVRRDGNAEQVEFALRLEARNRF